VGSRNVRLILPPFIPENDLPTYWSQMDLEVAGTIERLVTEAAASFGGTVTILNAPDTNPSVDGSPSAPKPTLTLAVVENPDADPEAFTIEPSGGGTQVVAATPRGLLYGLFELVRQGEAAFAAGFAASEPKYYAPHTHLRMVDHWDNIKKHDVMGQVERGYSGGSIFYDDGTVREDLSQVARYAQLLASVGINRVSINNVNVGQLETRLLDDLLPEVKRIADIFRPWGITTFISVSWAAPARIGGLANTDPFNPEVQQWWAQAAQKVWNEIPDFGGFVIKADSEGQPGPFVYGRSHADGANMLARAVAPFGGEIYWRAFVYNHEQNWRDRSTDRAKAAYQHFAPHDGTFEPNVIVQIKYGPLDFQVREATSPALAAMPNTRTAAEFQITTEYLGHQKHAVYLGRMWSELMNFRYFDDGTTMADIAAGLGSHRSIGAGRDGVRLISDSPLAGGFAAVSNVGDDYFYTGHPFSQANLYAWGRLTWNPQQDPIEILDEWAHLTFPGATNEQIEAVHKILDESWETYEMYTAPLGVCFMVYPHSHYGPSPDGYEYTPWGTYHFADRDGVGVDRTRATGSGFTGQYPKPWSDIYESLETVPDELLLFFHHVPYTHQLKSGKTVIQHIYDTHFEGLERVNDAVNTWNEIKQQFPADISQRVDERLVEQVRSATDWRDIINTYFYRKSGRSDAKNRQIYA
jgi:alpha-glucuronidase